MDSTAADRFAAATFAFLLVSSAGVVAGLADGVSSGDRPTAAVEFPDQRHASTADRPARPAHRPARPAHTTRSDRFVDDVAASRALDAPRTAANVTLTADGGRASVTGTDDVVANAPVAISATQRFALTPADPGDVEVTHAFEIPAAVTSLATPAPENATVTGTEGFTRNGSRRYDWDGETRRATITYTIPVNRTVDLSGPEGAEGRYLLVDAGPWALFRRPQFTATWSWRGGEPVDVEREFATAGPGHTGEWFVFLGPSETVTRTAHGQTFSLVIPDAASLAEDPASILDSLSTASDQLRVGDRDETVTLFAAPSTVAWGVRGLQFGDTDAWVRDAERLDEPDNTWLHEYVHTRQAFGTTSSAQWLTEASATYYAALLALEQDRVGFPAFRAFLERGTRVPQSESVLANPRSWANVANYWKGSLVTGAVDRQIRLATDGRRTFGTVFSRLNVVTGPVDHGTLLAVVASVAGDPVGRYADGHASTSRAPSLWSSTEHEAAFGGTPARLTYWIASDGMWGSDNTGESDGTGESNDGGASDGSGASEGAGESDGSVPVTGGPERVAVSGPYRNETLSGPTLSLYTGETLTVTGVVSNAGGATADYEQFFTVGNRVRSTVTGRLTPGETATHTFRHTVRSAGDVTVTFGTDDLAVEVYEPAEATVERVAADRTSLDRPGTVTLSVTVGNGFDVPASKTVTVTRDGSAVATRNVSLDARANRTIAVPVELAAPGTYRLGVANAGSVTVTVGDGDQSTGDGDSTDGEPAKSGSGPDGVTTEPNETPASTTATGSGYGLLAGILGLVSGLVALRKRR